MLYTNELIDLDRLERQGKERKENRHRIKILRITPEVLACFLTSTTLEIKSELPADIEIIRWQISRDGRFFELAICSEEFPILGVAEAVEYINPSDIVFTRLDNGELS